MIRKNFRKIISLILAMTVVCLSLFSTGAVSAYAVGEKADVYIVEFPRSGDTNTSGWGHEALQYMNGWSSGDASNKLMLRAIGSYTGKICYCIEPGTGQHTGDTFIQKDENFWDNFSEEYNRTIDADTVKLMIGRILQYGYTGNVSTEWRTQNPDSAYTLAYAVATQLLIWETIVGERDWDFQHVDTGNCNRILEFIRENNPIRSQIMEYYTRIEKSVQNHIKVPSFFAKSASKARTVELSWDGKQYVAVLHDANNTLSEYSFKSDNSDVSFQVNGNTLTVTSQTAPSKEITVTAEKKNSARKGLITWTDGIYVPGKGSQDMVTYAQSVNDPVKGYLNLKVSYGSAKIVKTSEDGKVDGITFRIQGNGIDKTVKTANGGQIQVDNLMSGVYTVTELVDSKYESQEVRRVTVVSGQTSTVTFNNVLKRGDLTVTKTAEDGLNEGVKFHLFGTSLSGLAVDEYAVTDRWGKAYFKDVLIGTDYTLEEIDTAIRYVVPEKQTADIEWNEVKNKSFNNILKKWNATVTKSDKETGNPQGDASLAGAEYGVYKGNQLIDTYTTDKNGQFTTKYYVCGDDWSVREIKASEGYLLNTEVLHIGAEAKLYTAEYNLSSPLDTLETIQKGKIALIKHCDDGSTQIETPEAGAEFEVYLKKSGSYAKAKETERDILVCNAFGFAETKDLPYGIYTVKQTKGWEGKELIKPFDVFMNKDGETYRYIINNAAFESLVEIVKKDIETGKDIPASGIGFKVRNTDTGEYIVQHINYPTPADIDTYYTDSTGKLMMPKALPYGNYEIIEQNTCYGYVLDSAPVAFIVDGSQTIVTVEKHNIAQKGTITVTKTGEVFSSVAESDGLYQPVFSVQGLAGAVYEITAAEDIYTLDGTLRCAKGTVVAEITTDKDGKAVTEPLYLGQYAVKEITAPYGMIISDEVHSVELTYAGQEIEITETATSFYNERQKAAVSLDKVLEQDEKFGIGKNGEMIGVTFGLFAAEDLTATDGSVIPCDGLLESLSVDGNGHAVCRTDLPFGRFYLKELSTDEHYILSDEKHPIVFEYAGQKSVLVEIKANNGEAIKNNLIYGTVKGMKVDRATEEVITGALFGLFRSDETEFTAEKAILTAVSDENGVFTFENVPYGDWIVKELQPAENYLLGADVYPIAVSDNGQIIEIIAMNDRVPEIAPPVPEIPKTGENSNMGFFIGLGAIGIGGLVSVVIIYFKKKRDDDSE